MVKGRQMATKLNQLNTAIIIGLILVLILLLNFLATGIMVNK